MTPRPTTPPKKTLASKAARHSRRTAARTPPPGWHDPLAPQQPLVSGRWLIRALVIVVAGAAGATYLTLCLLFYQGQWQIVFQPSRTLAVTPASAGLQYNEVHFDYTQTGTAQLAGWWIPADPGGERNARTLLFLHDGRGSLADVVPQLNALHSLGVNLFAFDYRGFGNSANDHPSEQRVYQDADAAWSYLADIRHLNPRSIVLYGTGLGATIAAETALRHPQLPALVLENPAPPSLSLIEADSRTHLLPVRWLFRDRFEIDPKLQQLGVKLDGNAAGMLQRGESPTSPMVLQPPANSGRKLLVLLGPHPVNDPNYLSTLRDFLSPAP